MPKVSVIIPVYNTENFLRKCLDSVCNQTLQDIEIICINDCSTDGSLEILREYAGKDNRIKLIELFENGGAAKARNIGIDIAHGEYIGFVDSDDFVDLDFYEKLYNKAVETNSDVVKSNLIFENFPNENNENIYHNIAEVRANKLRLNHIPTLIIKKETITQNKITFPEDLACLEDSVFEIQIAYYSNKIEIEEGTNYRYRFNNSSLNNSQTYTEEKNNSLINSLIYIIKFLNTINISKDLYKEIIQHRYDSIVGFYISKYNYNISDLNAFKSKLKIVESLIKHPISTPQLSKLNLLEKIAFVNSTVQKNVSIPKRIFYVWFGKDKTTLANICIQNWKDKLPDYELAEINEHSEFFNFEKEYNTCRWFKDMYDRKLWAFAADYARCKALYDHGGIYFDTDITLVKKPDDLLQYPLFIGEEEPARINAGVLGSIMSHPYLDKILDFYNNKIYSSPLYIIPDILTHIYENNEFDNIKIFPPEYFYPFTFRTKFQSECITENSYTIHWWSASWVDSKSNFYLQNKHVLSNIRSKARLIYAKN